MAKNGEYKIEKGKGGSTKEFYPLDRNVIMDDHISVPKNTASSTNLAVRLGKYSKNLLKSTTKLTADVVGGYTPNVKDFGKSLADTARLAKEEATDKFNQIKDFLGKTKKNAAKASGEDAAAEAYKSIGKIGKDMANRFKTGNFYRTDSENMEAAMNEEFGLNDLDTNFDTGDFDDIGTSGDGGDFGGGGATGSYEYTSPETELADEPFGEPTTTVRKRAIKGYAGASSRKARSSSKKSVIINNISSGNGQQVRLGDKLVADTNTTLGTALMNQNEHLWAKTFAADELRFEKISSYQRNILEGVNSINNHLQNVESKNTAAQMEFQGKNLALQEETLGLLKELREIQLSSLPVIKGSQPAQKSKMSKVTSGGGGLNSEEYWKNIKGNFSEIVGGSSYGMLLQSMPMMASMLGLAKDSGMDKSFDPISLTMRMLLGSKISSRTKGKLSAIDDLYSNAGSLFIGKMNELSKYGKNDFVKNLGKLFGVKETYAKQVDLSIKDPNATIGWTAKSDKTLNEVIPAYLSRMTAALTGSDETFYDYKAGAFRTQKSLHDEYATTKKSAYSNAQLDNFNTRMAAAGGNDEFAKKKGISDSDLQSDFDNIRINIGKTMMSFSPERLNDPSYYKQLVAGCKHSESLVVFKRQYENLTAQDQLNFDAATIGQNSKAAEYLLSWSKEKADFGGGAIAAGFQNKDELESLKRSFEHDRQYQLDGLPTNSPEYLKRQRARNDMMKKIRALESSVKSGNEYDIKATRIDSTGMIMDQDSGSLTGKSMIGTVNNIFSLLSKGIIVYPEKLKGGKLPDHLTKIYSAQHIQFEEASRIEKEGLVADAARQRDIAEGEAAARKTAREQQQQMRFGPGEMFNAYFNPNGAKREADKEKSWFNRFVSGMSDEFVDLTSGVMGSPGRKHATGNRNAEYDQYMQNLRDQQITNLQNKISSWSIRKASAESSYRLLPKDKRSVKGKIYIETIKISLKAISQAKKSIANLQANKATLENDTLGTGNGKDTKLDKFFKELNLQVVGLYDKYIDNARSVQTDTGEQEESFFNGVYGGQGTDGMTMNTADMHNFNGSVLKSMGKEAGKEQFDEAKGAVKSDASAAKEKAATIGSKVIDEFSSGKITSDIKTAKSKLTKENAKASILKAKGKAADIGGSVGSKISEAFNPSTGTIEKDTNTETENEAVENATLHAGSVLKDIVDEINQTGDNTDKETVLGKIKEKMDDGSLDYDIGMKVFSFIDKLNPGKNSKFKKGYDKVVREISYRMMKLGAKRSQTSKRKRMSKAEREANQYINRVDEEKSNEKKATKSVLGTILGYAKNPLEFVGGIGLALFGHPLMGAAVFAPQFIRATKKIKTGLGIVDAHVNLAALNPTVNDAKKYAYVNNAKNHAIEWALAGNPAKESPTKQQLIEENKIALSNFATINNIIKSVEDTGKDLTDPKLDKMINKLMAECIKAGTLSQEVADAIIKLENEYKAKGFPAYYALSKAATALRKQYDRDFFKEKVNAAPASKVAKAILKWTGIAAGSAYGIASGNGILAAGLIAAGLRTSPVWKKLIHKMTSGDGNKGKIKNAMNDRAIAKYGVAVSPFDAILGISPTSKLSDKELEAEQRIAAQSFKALEEIQKNCENGIASAGADPNDPETGDAVIEVLKNAIKTNQIDKDVGEIVIGRVKNNMQNGKSPIDALEEARNTIQKNYSKFFKKQNHRRGRGVGGKILKGLATTGKLAGIIGLGLWHPVAAAALAATWIVKHKQMKKDRVDASDRDELDGILKRDHSIIDNGGATESDSAKPAKKGILAKIKGMFGPREGSAEDKTDKDKEEADKKKRLSFAEMMSAGMVELGLVRKGLGINDKGEIDEKSKADVSDAKQEKKKKGDKNKKTLASIMMAGTAISRAAAEDTEKIAKKNNGGGSGDAVSKGKGILSKFADLFKSAGGGGKLGAIQSIASLLGIALTAGSAVTNIKEAVGKDGVGGAIGEITGLRRSKDSSLNADGTEKSGLLKGIQSINWQRSFMLPAGQQMLKTGKALAKGTANIVKDVAKDGIKGAGKGLVDSLKGTLVKVFNNPLIKKLAGKLKLTDFVNSISSKIGGNVEKVAAQQAGKTAGNVAKKGAMAIPIAGWIWAAADCILAFTSGWNNAGRYFKVKHTDLTTGMKVASMLFEGLKALVADLISLIPAGGGIAALGSMLIDIALPPGTIVPWLYKLVAGKAAAEELAEKQDQLKQDAAELGISDTKYAELSNKSTFDKIKETGGRAINKLANLFGKGKTDAQYQQDYDKNRLTKAGLSEEQASRFVEQNNTQTQVSGINPNTSQEGKKLGLDNSKGMMFPVSGTLSSAYGMRAPYNHATGQMDPNMQSLHGGIDIATPSGTPVKAAADGTVVNVYAPEKNDYTFGGEVAIKHTNGVVTIYAHLKEIYVKVGNKIKKGFVIGLSGGGKTDVGHGGSTGPHLHWTTMYKGRTLNPIEVVNEGGKVSDRTEGNPFGSQYAKAAAGQAGQAGSGKATPSNLASTTPEPVSPTATDYESPKDNPDSKEAKAAATTQEKFNNSSEGKSQAQYAKAAVGGAATAVGGVASAQTAMKGETTSNPVGLKESPYITNDKVMTEYVSSIVATMDAIKNEMTRHDSVAEQFFAFMMKNMAAFVGGKTPSKDQLAKMLGSTGIVSETTDQVDSSFIRDTTRLSKGFQSI